MGATIAEAVERIHCPPSVPPETPPGAGSPLATFDLLPDTRWQPVGGEVQFKLTQIEKPLENIAVYFAWEVLKSGESEGKAVYCHRSTRVRLLPKTDGDDDKTYRYAARVPNFGDDPVAFPRLEGSGRRTWGSTVPLADIFVNGTVKGDDGKPAPVVVTGTVGITTRWPAFLGAFLSVAAVSAILAKWAKAQKISGGFFLRVISTPNGVASLSQFQIIIWTFVIGAGVVYVMMLTGNLIDIPLATLGLLGVSGLSLVGSKLKAGADGSPQRISAPGMVTNLSVSGSPTADTIILNWAPPAGTEQPFTYTVRRRFSGGNPWIAVANEVGGPPFAVSGLDAATDYDFEVFAVNAGGAGPASVPLKATTAAGIAAAAPGAPGRVACLTAIAQPDGAVKLTWTALAPQPDSYTVQYRETGSTSWSTYSSTASAPTVVGGLDRGTHYEFQVFAVAGGVAGSPAEPAAAVTAPRTPRWSDLVMSGDDQPEVDLARVQMLVFTSISAVFTALTLVNTGMIPDIPVGELALVGVSNGVYLASKVVDR